jgi:uncharacterized protein (TIGR02646 family)
MMLQFRVKSPIRSYTGPDLDPYYKYKPFLKNDFNSRCGYTDCPDFWFGGSSSFHIDHFKPKSIHGQLTNNYSNLVYCCSHVNLAKSADDVDYIDPCLEDYNDHFYRDIGGNIHPNEDSERAKYMHKRLKLYLKRYSAIWVLDQLYQKMKLIKNAIEDLPSGEDKNDLISIMGELGVKFTCYLEYLEANR